MGTSETSEIRDHDATECTARYDRINQRLEVTEHDVSEMKAEILDNAKFRQQALGACWVIAGLAAFFSSVTLIARTIAGIL